MFFFQFLGFSFSTTYCWTSKSISNRIRFEWKAIKMSKSRVTVKKFNFLNNSQWEHQPSANNPCYVAFKEFDLEKSHCYCWSLSSDTVKQIHTHIMELFSLQNQNRKMCCTCIDRHHAEPHCIIHFLFDVRFVCFVQWKGFFLSNENFLISINFAPDKTM